MSSNMKDRLDAKLKAAQAEIAEQKVVVQVRETDPELDEAKAKVKAGILADAYRTRNGALVTTLPEKK